MAEKSNPLVCAQCGYANEGERVYCHNCGTKLDRTLLPSLNKPEEPLDKKRKRIKKIVTPNRGFFAGAGKAFLYTMLASILVAMLILVAMPPDDIPAAPNADDLPDSPTMELDNDLSGNAPVPIQWKQDALNAYLATKTKGAGNGMLGDSVKLVRAFVNLDEDRLRFTADQTVFGHHIYSTVYYKLEISGGKLQSTVKGGNFGRLQIHPNMMKNLTAVFQAIWDSNEMKQAKRMLDECQSFDVHKGEVDVVTKPRPQQ